MIGRLSGTLLEKNPPQILLDVQGIAYEVDVPMSTFYNLPATGERIVLFTHLVVREDAHLLFGFGTEHERRAFRQLLKISGVGARTALSVLSDRGDWLYHDYEKSIRELRAAAAERDQARGVLAERDAAIASRDHEILRRGGLRWWLKLPLYRLGILKPPSV